jgi:cytochrome c
VKNDFEFDKIVVAAALGIFTLIMSANIGDMFYIPNKNPVSKGYIIEITEGDNAASAPQGLPDVIDIKAVLNNADAELGKKIFNKCAICHTINKGEANKIGPNLWGIVNTQTAKHADFAYSDAMKKRGSEGKIWDLESLYRYIYAPRKYVEGTKMAFAGIKNDQERANLIMYLRSMSDNVAPIS